MFMFFLSFPLFWLQHYNGDFNILRMMCDYICLQTVDKYISWLRFSKDEALEVYIHEIFLIFCCLEFRLALFFYAKRHSSLTTFFCHALTSVYSLVEFCATAALFYVVSIIKASKSIYLIKKNRKFLSVCCS